MLKSLWHLGSCNVFKLNWPVVCHSVSFLFFSFCSLAMGLKTVLASIIAEYRSGSEDALISASRDLQVKLGGVGPTAGKEGEAEPLGPQSHLPALRGGAPEAEEPLNLRDALPEEGVPELKYGPAVSWEGLKLSML